MTRASRILDVTIVVLLTVVVLAHWGGRLPAPAQVKRAVRNLIGERPGVSSLAADSKTNTGDAPGPATQTNGRVKSIDPHGTGRVIVYRYVAPVYGTHRPFCR